MAVIANMKLLYHMMLAFSLRLLLLVYGEWQDMTFTVSYTDIDYHVFTDASRYMSSGDSPYKRSTYRYPPILAALLLPNIWIHRSFGKVLFGIFDVIAGGLGALLTKSSHSSKTTLFLCLYNPMTAIISTRGSADSLSSALVISSIMAAVKGYAVTAGIILALAAHLRVYPVLFILPMWLSFSKDCVSIHPLKEFPRTFCLKHWFSFTWTLAADLRRCYFLASFACALGVLTGVSYALYGYQFLQESYFYHFTRVDTRHNFSVNFYMFLLSGNVLPSFITFLPQLLVIVCLGMKYGTLYDLPFACFCQVYIFVVFNKVVTAQYFIWPLSIFPIIMPKLTQTLNHRSDLDVKESTHSKNLSDFILGVSVWSVSVALWLYSAYKLEFLGENTFFHIWVCSLFLFGTNVHNMKKLIKIYDFNKQLELLPNDKLE